MTAAATVVDVAVGLVFDRSGRVLLGQRPAGKPYAGWWEFPGGKFEPGETAAQALARELREELGLQVERSRPWIVREHVYPHAHVRLWFRRVHHWRGRPESLEGQAFDWVHPGAIDRAPLLPATVPVLAMLALPERLIGLAAERPGVPGGAPADIDAERSGQAPLLVLDGGMASGDALVARLRELRQSAPAARICRTGSWPAGAAQGCDGIVASAAGLAAGPRTAGFLRGLRIDVLDELRFLAKADADFAVVLPDVSAHYDEFARVLDRTPIPVYLRVDVDVNAGLRPEGLHGLAEAYWGRADEGPSCAASGSSSAGSSPPSSIR